MNTIHCRWVSIAALALLSSSVGASRTGPSSQPPVWANQPNIAAFEKLENERLAAAQTAIDKIAAEKGARTVENTLSVYDEAIRQINTSAYLAVLMQQVHPEAEFRDHATSMLQKAVSVQ